MRVVNGELWTNYEQQCAALTDLSCVLAVVGKEEMKEITIKFWGPIATE